MKGKKSLLTGMLLAALLSLTGCVGVIRERPMEDISGIAIDPGVSAPLEDGSVDEMRRTTLYYPSADEEHLVPVVREVVITAGESRAQAVLNALLEGPGTEGIFWPKTAGKTERMLEVSGGVATVSLPARLRALEPQQLYAVRLAVAHTLCELPEISYVNVLIGGREEGLDLGATMPVGTLSRMEDLEMLSRYNRMDDQRLSGAGFNRLTTLYLPSAADQMLLPTVRSVAYGQASPLDCLYTVLGELGKGAPTSAKEIPAPMEYIEEMPDIVRTDDGSVRAIEIRFSGKLNEALKASGLTFELYAAMLTDTLMGLVPGVEGVQLFVDGRKMGGIVTREDFAGKTGAPVVLYVPAGEACRLRRVRRVLPEDRQYDPRALLMKLSEEPGVLPVKLTEEDILAVRFEENDVAVNFSGAFGDALYALEADEARTAVYAMVNTLTEGRSQQGVVFFFDGQQRGEMNGGLNLAGRLVRNPGMVEE